MTTEKLRYTLENPNSRAREKVSETKLNYANKVFTNPYEYCRAGRGRHRP